MKVLCINDGALPSDNVCPVDAPPFDVKEGETYTVIDAFVSDGYCWYVLSEDPYNEILDEDGEGYTQWGHDSQRFASLTETESALNEAVKITELTPHEETEKPKKWYQKIFQ